MGCGFPQYMTTNRPEKGIEIHGTFPYRWIENLKWLIVRHQGWHTQDFSGANAFAESGPS